MISETKTREVLEYLEKQGRSVSKYAITQIIGGDWDSRERNLEYLINIGFVDYNFITGHGMYSISEKGLKLIGKERVSNMSRTKTVNKVQEWKQGKLEKLLQSINEKPGQTIRELMDEKDSLSSVYNLLEELYEEGKVEKGKKGNKNVYYPTSHVPEKTTKKDTSPPPLEKDDNTPTRMEEVKDTPSEIESPVNENGTDDKFTIGKILDLVWPHCYKVNIVKKNGLKNMENDSVISQFTNHDEMIKVYLNLPKPLKERAIPTIQRQGRKKIQLNIPVPE